MKRVYFPKISKQVLLFQIQKHFNIISYNNVRKDIRHLPISNASYFTTRYTIWCIILSTVVLLGKLQMMSRTLDEVKNFTPVFLWGFVNQVFVQWPFLFWRQHSQVMLSYPPPLCQCYTLVMMNSITSCFLAGDFIPETGHN